MSLALRFGLPPALRFGKSFAPWRFGPSLSARRFGLSASAVALLLCGVVGAQEPAVAVRKIWDRAPHNAFTDLIRHDDRWFCAFREGKAHVSPDGALRVLTSSDGEAWESAALVTSPTADLRDAKLCRTPAGELMLTGAEALHDRAVASHRSVAWFSRDGRQWDERHEIGDPNYWLRRTTWHGDRAYNVGYSVTKERGIRVYSSADGRRFDLLGARPDVAGFPNEASLVFVDDVAYCLLRRDGEPNTALLGTARKPYESWTWRDLGVRIGGPNVIRLPDGRLLAAVRLYDGKQRTALAWLDPVAGTLTEIRDPEFKIPSGGDTSYAGLVHHEDRLHMSYYSSHEGKAAIYLATVRLPSAEK